MAETPEMQVQLVSSHGMLAMLEVLQGRPSPDVIMRLLQIVNLVCLGLFAGAGSSLTSCVACDRRLRCVGELLFAWRDSNRHGYGFFSRVLLMLMAGRVGCRFHDQEVSLGSPGGGVEFHSAAVSFFGYDITDVHLVCPLPFILSYALSLTLFSVLFSTRNRGLKTLVELLDEDYSEQTDLVAYALNGIGSVFELQSPTSKNDFCRMFIREGLLEPLSNVLLNVMGNREEEVREMKEKIIQIVLVFSQVSQSDIHVRNALGTRSVVRREPVFLSLLNETNGCCLLCFVGLLRACEMLEPDCLVLMLKAVKHLSMSSTLLDVLQNVNAIEILVKILEEQSSGPHSTVCHPLSSPPRTTRLNALARKYRITSSKRCTTSAVSTKHVRSRQRKLGSYLVLSESSRQALL
jgi:hypothetical protein